MASDRRSKSVSALQGFFHTPSIQYCAILLLVSHRTNWLSGFGRLKPISTEYDPHLIVDGSFNDKSLQHMVIIYDFIEQRVYINGELKAQSDVP